MVDFQGVCLQRALRLEKSSGGLFRGVRLHGFLICVSHRSVSSVLSDPSDDINHVLESDQSYRHVCYFSLFFTVRNRSSGIFNRVLVRDILFWPQWTYAAKKANVANQNLTVESPPPQTHVRESLSNILLTHIDFRRPTLDYKRMNNTKDDEAIEKVPESCIEEFNLYVSTWKGWQGPLPSKDNSIGWEQVERENTVHSTISCTHVVKEPTEEFDDPYGNSSNGTNFSTTVPTPPPLPTAESFR